MQPAVSEQSVQSSGAVDDGDDLDSFRYTTIQDEIVAGWQIPKLGRAMSGAGAAEEGIGGKEEALAVDLLEQPVGSIGIVCRDIEPDID